MSLVTAGFEVPAMNPVPMKVVPDVHPSAHMTGRFLPWEGRHVRCSVFLPNLVCTSAHSVIRRALLMPGRLSTPYQKKCDNITVEVTLR